VSTELLDSLIAAWRDTRAPELADAIDRVSDALLVNEKPLRTKAAWEAALASKRATVLPRLLEASPDSNDRAIRLAAIHELPPDPRMGTFSLRWLETPPVDRKRRHDFFFEVMNLIIVSKDVRVLPKLEKLAAERSYAIQCCGLTNFKHIVELAKSLREFKPKPITAAMKALIEKAAPPKVTADPAELLARVYADPADDAVRAVLADLLTERGDPRGEFISLQLARFGTKQEPSAAEKKLQKTWERAWLGAIEPAAMKNGVEFERGFASRVRLSKIAEVLPTLRASEWLTVTSIDVGHANGEGIDDLLRSPLFQRLRAATGVNYVHAKSLPKQTWETVGFLLWRWDSTASLTSAPFPKAKRLILDSMETRSFEPTPEEVAALLAKWPTIEDVDLPVHPTWLPRIVATAPAHVRRFACLNGLHDSRFDRDTKTLAMWPTGVAGRISDADGTAMAKMIERSSPSRVEITMASPKAKLDGDVVTYNHGTMNLAPVRAAAKAAGAVLVFQSMTLS
jgi:uncharacterized protein (TIGR02996 family)